MVKWIYQYLRADGEEIDMGPFKTKKEAFKAHAMHERVGAMCLVPTFVEDDYELFKG